MFDSSSRLGEGWTKGGGEFTCGMVMRDSIQDAKVSFQSNGSNVGGVRAANWGRIGESHRNRGRIGESNRNRITAGYGANGDGPGGRRG